MPVKYVEDPSSQYSGYPALSSDQQKLLLNALQSNERRLPASDLSRLAPDYQEDNRIFKTVSNGRTINDSVDPTALISGRLQPSNGSTSSGVPTFGDHFFPDLSNGQDADFDSDLSPDVTVLSSFAPGESGEKRKMSEDSDDDEENDAKRGEADDKQPKKPGRKPVLAEPTTKRKAQNRAAQRAFRERKEQHLKNLEDKINDLQHVSTTATQENSLLRAQVFRLQSELQDYKKRMSVGIGSVPSATPGRNSFSNVPNGYPTGNNPFDFSFGADNMAIHFPSPQNLSKTSTRSFSDPFVAEIKKEPLSRSGSEGDSSSPNTRNGSLEHQRPQLGSSQSGRQFNTNSAGDLSTPSSYLFNSNSYGFPTFGSPASLTNGLSPAPQRDSNSSSDPAPSLSGGSGSSPSCSSTSNNGQTSSCGTSPEPVYETNSDKQVSAFGDLADFQFNPDPSLFGDYREPQNNILGEGEFSGGLYDDWLNMSNDPTLDYSLTASGKPPTPHMPNKASLMDQVEQVREASGDDDVFEFGPPDKKDAQEMLNCHKIWQKLRTCPKFQDGGLDIDSLCSELSKKATCSETGATISKREWENALWRIAGVREDDPQGQTAN